MRDTSDRKRMLMAGIRRANSRRSSVPIMVGLSTIILMLGLIAVPLTAHAVVPDPTHAFIGSISYGGSGCPQGSMAQSFSNDRETFTLIFDSYVALLGPGVPISENRKDCQLLVTINAPVGFAFAVTRLDHRGYSQLDTNVTGRVVGTAEVIDGNPGQFFEPLEVTFPGPTSRDYLNRSSFGPVKWSACGGPSLLRINTSVEIENVGDNPGAQGQLTMDSIDGKMEQGVNIIWRKCNNGHADGLATAFVQSLSYGGTGCPQGSVGQAFTPTRNTFTLVFDQFVASSGPGIPVTESRKNCQLNINVSAPAGWAWRLVGLDVDGFTRVPDESEAKMETSAYLEGDLVGTAEDGFAGPLSDSYALTQDVMQGTSQWSSCDGGVTPLNLNTQVRVISASGTNALATIDVINGRIAWRRCGPH